MCQWKASSVIHAASIAPGTSLSISQLIRIERHRGGSHAALRVPHYEQHSPELDLGLDSPSWRRFFPNNADRAPRGESVTSVASKANGNTVQPLICGSSSGLLHTTPSSRLALLRRSRINADRSHGKPHRRQATQSASPLPPTLKVSSQKSIYTQTGPSSSRLPLLVPNKVAASFKVPLKSKKQGDDAFREMDHGETVHAWPMSSEEREAEARRQDQARLIQETQERQAKEREEHERAAQETAARRHEQEQLQLQERSRALALQQRYKEQREIWMAGVSASAARLQSVTAQLENLRSHIEVLLESRRRTLWEEKAKIFETAVENASQRMEHNRRLFGMHADGSRALGEALADFCETVSRNVHGEGYRRMVPAYKSLPRDMFGPRDTTKRIAQLYAIFWMQVHQQSWVEGTMQESHLWRHFHAARIMHELHPKAFSYRIHFSRWYGNVQRLIGSADALWWDHIFWKDHTELLSPSRWENVSENVIARRSRRQQLATLQRFTAKDIKRDLSQILDRGNFVIGQRTNDFKRQQQIALRKPFTLVQQSLRDLETEADRIDWEYVSEEHPSLGKVKHFKWKLRTLLDKAFETSRSYLAEIEILTYWNWLATERKMPQRRMSYRGLSKPIDMEAAVARKESVFGFKHDISADQVWRYTKFRNPDGRQVVVDYCATPQFAERTARFFRNNKVIGIDLWGGRRFASIEDAVREGNSARRCLPMIAIANEERIALFHFAAMTNETHLLRLPTLLQVLEDPAICKVGENVRALRQRLLMYMGVSLEGAVDLDPIYTKVSKSSTNKKRLNYAPALARPQTSTGASFSEPCTATRISDQLQKYAGQSLGDDTVNPEDLQRRRIDSPKVLQLSASRPYAALYLHHILAQRSQIDGKKSPSLSAKPKTRTKGNFAPTSFGDPSVLAEHDLGPVNIDPCSGFQHSQLRALATALATALAEVIRGKISGTIPDSHFEAYVLFTRFGQSCDNILRIVQFRKLKILKNPADAISSLVKTTGLPLSEEMFTQLKTWKGSGLEEQATKWIKKTIANAPVLLRMHRRSEQVRMELKAYAMWHHLEMDVGDIAEYLRTSWRRISGEETFRLIRKTLKYGNPPFPFQRARYLELLWKYAPEEYSKELDRTSEDTSALVAGDATEDTLSINALDSVDDEEPENEVELPPVVQKITKKRPFKTASLRKGYPITAKAHRKLRKIESTYRKVHRYMESEPLPSSSEQDLIAWSPFTKASKGSITGTQKRSPGDSISPAKVTEPERKTFVRKIEPERKKLVRRVASEKEQTSDSQGLDQSQGITVGRPVESAAIDPDTVGKEAPSEQRKLSQSRRRIRQRRQAAKKSLAKLSGTTATPSSETIQVSSNAHEEGHAQQSTERPKGTLQDPDLPKKTIRRMKPRNARPVAQGEAAGGPKLAAEPSPQISWYLSTRYPN